MRIILLLFYRFRFLVPCLLWTVSGCLRPSGPCDSFQTLDGFKEAYIPESPRLLAISEYFNVTQSKDRHLPKNYTGYSKENLLALRFTDNEGKEATVVFLDPGHLVGILRDQKLVFCDAK